ncbi:hypothetical protein [Nonomuraea sp. NPDC049480]|uniref:hypothetical protein n=1 Tax=Nonomuraea sp. NPDC049480 TaxID=3364353 RepID=UPI00379CDB1B
MDQLAAMARDAGIMVAIDIVGSPPDLSTPVDHTAYRILQESITNVIRRATATR